MDVKRLEAYGRLGVGDWTLRGWMLGYEEGERGVAEM